MNLIIPCLVRYAISVSCEDGGLAIERNFLVAPVCFLLLLLLLYISPCFDFRFNYRSTHHLVSHGFYKFLNWFDERAWYPLGRIVGGTVSVENSILNL